MNQRIVTGILFLTLFLLMIVNLFSSVLPENKMKTRKKSCCQKSRMKYGKGGCGCRSAPYSKKGSCDCGCGLKMTHFNDLVEFSPNCCPSQVTSSNGCMCVTPRIQSILMTRGNNKS